MKKIDLHLHTKSTISDSDFNFSLEKLEEYVVKLEIDCIAITNHNLFDLTQYERIADTLEIPVFPGIEIDLEGGHLLLISERKNLTDFATKCQKVNDLINSSSDEIIVDQLKKIFGDLKKYLLIPHYDKKPNIREDTYQKLKEFISAGEVTSIKKFKACINDEQRLVPVLFSDSRFSPETDTFSTRQTFVELDSISLSGIKSCLFDKNKVFLSKDDGNDLFQATEDGLMLSTGLNVILGERSSGKTYTLDSIAEASGNVKYIEQFSLLDKDEEKFKKLLSIRKSNVSESYLKEFKSVVDDVINIDLKQNEIEIDTYITSLLNYASEADQEDAFSKTKLFSENKFSEKDLSGLESIISAVELLIDNKEYRSSIDKHVDIKSLKLLILSLIDKYGQEKNMNLKKKWVNDLISNVQEELRVRSASTFPEDIDFYDILMDREKIKRYAEVVNELKTEKEIYSQDIQGFKVVAKAKKFTGAQKLKNKSGRKIAFRDAFDKYDKPYDYLSQLKELDVPQTELYKYFIDIDYDTLNKDGFKVSGGERSEFNLLYEINDAQKYDMLLIDEPESSFDNLFLKNKVNSLLRDISKNIPVIIVTHNSTIGASIKPNQIACTQKHTFHNKVSYEVYFGQPADKKLRNSSGDKIDNFENILNCLEAGETAYNDRRAESYEILKD